MDVVLEVKNSNCDIDEMPTSLIKGNSSSTCKESLEINCNDYIEEVSEEKIPDIHTVMDDVECDISHGTNIEGEEVSLIKKTKTDFQANVSSDECSIDKSVKGRKRNVSSIHRKSLSDIYCSGSELDENEIKKDKVDKKTYDDDIEFQLKVTNPKKRKIVENKSNADEIASTSKNKTSESCSSIRSEKTSKKLQKTVSDELKRMIVDSIETGVCTRQTASSVFQVPYSTVVHIYKRFLETGIVEKQNKDVKLSDEHVKFIADKLAEDCSYTIKELTEMVQTEFSIEVSNASVSKKIAAFHYNIKRDIEPSTITITDEIIKDHKEYCTLFLELYNAGHHIVYFDETDYKVTMRRFFGRVDPGIPGQVIAPSLRKRHRTIMLSMNNERILYCKSFDEPRSRTDLLDCVRELFRALRKRNMQGAVLVMGTSAFQCASDIKKMAKLDGYQLLFLPLHNKWFNPTDPMFNQWINVVHYRSPVNEKHLETLIDNFAGLSGDKQCKNYCNKIVENATKCTEGQEYYN